MKLFFSPSFLAISALLFLSLFAIKDLAKPDFYTSHDGETHTARMAQYWQALEDGQFPPRFAGSFYNGLGSPIFVYIYPLPYFLGSTLHTLGFSFVTSFKILMALGFIFSGIFSYVWLNELLKNQKAAFLGALFYMWVPYRFLLIYVRGSLSEVLAYTFVPIVFYFLTRLAKNPNLFLTSASAVAIALLLLSQNLVAAIAMPVIILYLLAISLQNKSTKSVVFGVLAIVWGFSISAFTYLPAIFERKFTRFDEIITIAYPDHFVTLKQLVRSPWGYGFDLPGTVNDQISLQIGLAHILVFLISAILIVGLLVKRKTNADLFFAIFFMSIFVASTFLMLQNKITSSIWREIKLLHTIDIPWRLLGISSLALSVLSAYIAKSVKPGLFFLFLIAAVLVANRNHLRINQSLVRDDLFFLNYTGTATQYNEFTPKWRQSTRVPIGFDQQVKVQSVSGRAQISNVAASSREIKFTAESAEKSQVRINKFYFPGLVVGDNEQKLTLGDKLIITDTATLHLDKEQDASGLILINLDKGEHRITAVFGETPLRTFANFLSLGVSLAALIAIGVKPFSRRNVKG